MRIVLSHPPEQSIFDFLQKATFTTSSLWPANCYFNFQLLYSKCHTMIVLSPLPLANKALSLLKLTE